MGSYVSSNKAIWRIFSFPNHERRPTVVHLAVHLENGQTVYFTTQNVLQRTIQPPSTTLTSFFSLCVRMMILPEHYYTQKCQNIILRINPQNSIITSTCFPPKPTDLLIKYNDEMFDVVLNQMRSRIGNLHLQFTE